MYRKPAGLVLLLLLAASVSAFPASMEVIDRIATQDSPAEFKLEVQNNFSERRSFGLSVSSPKQSWIYLERPKTVLPGEKASFRMYATPPEDAIQQNIGFTLKANTNAGESRSFKDYFTVDRKYELYITSITQDSQIYSPGDTISFNVEVLNTASAIVGNYTVTVETPNWKVSEKGIKIGPGGETSLQLSKEIPERETPGEKTFQVFISRNGEKQDSENRSFKVRKVVDIDRSVSENDQILYYSKKMSIENRGNTVENVRLNESFPSYLEPIAAFNPAPDQLTGEGRKEAVWSFELEPGDSRQVSYSVNYWAPLAILAVLLSGLLFANRMRKKLEFTKKAVREGDEVKIHVEIENNSNHSIHHVKIEDFIPDIASVNKDFPFAKPVMRKTGNGTRLTWEIDELEPGDQRVFEYFIKPRIEVEGSVKLPSAKILSEGKKLMETSRSEAEFRSGDT